jgi:hypothetical protein
MWRNHQEALKRTNHLMGRANQRVTLCTNILLAVAGPEAVQKMGHACAIDTFLTYNIRICICA